MTGSKKKGLSIGAAMKQRMDSQEEQAAPEVQKTIPSPDPNLEREAKRTVTSPIAPTETEVLESFNTRLPRGLHRRLKVYTATEGRKIQDVVAQALKDYLERTEKKES